MHVNLWLWSLYVNQWNLVFIYLLTLAIHEITVHKTCMTEEICLFTMIWEDGVLKHTHILDGMHTDCSSVHQQYNRYLQFFSAYTVLLICIFHIMPAVCFVFLYIAGSSHPWMVLLHTVYTTGCHLIRYMWLDTTLYLLSWLQ